MESNKIPLDNGPNLSEIQITSSSHQDPITHEKLKPKFNHKLAIWRCMTSSDISYINKYKPKMLPHILASSLNAENIGTSGLRNLRKALTDSKRAFSLTLESPEINAKQLTFLLDSTNHWRHFALLALQRSERVDRELIKTLPRLGRYKNLATPPFPAHFIEHHVNGKAANRYCRQLRGLNKLENLSLDLPLFNDPTVLNYKPPRSLTYLYLEFGNKALCDQSQLSIFVSNIQKCSQLQSLQLRFAQNYPIEPSDAEIWTSFFQNPPPLLQKLELFLDSNPAQQQPEGIQRFMEPLKHLKTLTTFNLDLHISSHPLNQPPKFLDALFSSLLTSLQCFTQLETFIFKSLTSWNLNKRNLQDLNSGLQCLKNLKNLTLELGLPSFNSPHESLVEIANSLKQLKSLQTLDLRLAPATPFSHESLQIFSKSLVGLPLTSLSLTLGSSNDMIKPLFDFSTIKNGFGKILGIFKNSEKPNLIPFFADISQFSTLSNIKLGLSAFQITPHEFKYLSHALIQLKNLSSLQLDLPQFDPSNNFEGLRILLSCLEDMTKLTRLTLIFKGNISNQEVGILSSSLIDCQSLTHLNLNFQKAAQLQDESLYFLLGALRSLLKLKVLSLLFEKQDLLTLLRQPNQEAFGDQAKSHFLQGLTVLKNLFAFDFTFNPFSIIQYDREALPPNLKGYEDIRQLTHLIVGNSRYI